MNAAKSVIVTMLSFSMLVVPICFNYNKNREENGFS